MTACCDKAPVPSSPPADAQRVYDEVGNLARAFDDPIVILAPLEPGCPIVAVSQGFASLSGRPALELPGRSFDLLMEGAPELLVSRSGRQTFSDFCRACGRRELSHIAPASMTQPLSRPDGSFFVCFCVFGLGFVKCRSRYIVGVTLPFEQGSLSSSEKAQLAEDGHAAIQRTRAKLRAVLGDPGLPDALGCAPRHPFAFFGERLSGQTMLSGAGCTVERREAEEVPKGCLVFGDRPMPMVPEGLSFRLRVDGATQRFVGLPLLGFTRRRPADEPGLYPVASRCLAASVLVGCSGEAFARDQSQNFRMGFSKPPASEVEAFEPIGSQQPMPALAVGDEIGCEYTWEGHIRFLLNGRALLDFDVKRPLREDASYFAVVDVCFSATAVTILPGLGCKTKRHEGEEVEPTSLPVKVTGLDQALSDARVGA